MIRNLVALSAATLALSASSVWAQTINVDMNDASAWSVVQDPDASAEFGFDYSIYGIPPAPNGSDSLGVRLAANIFDPGEGAAITITPKDLTFAGRYRVEVDAWLNFYGDPDNVGTTEFAGVFVGVDPTGAPINGAGLIGSTDGDAGRDYRLQLDEVELPFASGQYLVPSQNNTDPVFADEFPSEDPPTEQLDDFDPPNEEPIPFDGRLAFAWRRFTVVVDNLNALYSIDDLEIGFVDTDLNGIDLSGNVGLSLWDIFSSVAPEPEFAFAIFDNLSIEVLDGPGVEGDFNNNGQLDANDIDLLAAEIRDGGQDPVFDVDGSGNVSSADHTFWISTLRNTWFGDANLDDLFDTADLVGVLARGKYEDSVPLNAGWEEGDWNADGDFDSGDFVTALSDGGFEGGARPAVAVVVPEPSSLALATCALSLGALLRRRKRQGNA